MRDSLDIFGALRKPKGKAPALDLPGINTWQDFADAIYERLGKGRIHIRVTIDDTGPKDWMRKYFHAVVVKCITAGYRNYGYDYDDEETYTELKKLYCTPTPGKRLSTAKYSEVEFQRFMERCIRHGIEDLGLKDIPAPVSQTIEYFPGEER